MNKQIELLHYKEQFYSGDGEYLLINDYYISEDGNVKVVGSRKKNDQITEHYNNEFNIDVKLISALFNDIIELLNNIEGVIEIQDNCAGTFNVYYKEPGHYEVFDRGTKSKDSDAINLILEFLEKSNLVDLI